MPAASITSSKNPLLREIRRAVSRGTLTGDGLAVAESIHLLDEAITSGSEIAAVVVAESVRSKIEDQTRRLRSVQVTSVPDSVLREIADTETSQGVITLVRPVAWQPPQLFEGTPLVIVLDGIQDPGNAGAILRAAEAFRATGALLVKGTVNPYNPKAIRASAGSVFRLPLVAQLEAEHALAMLRQYRLDLYAATPHGKESAADVDFRHSCAIVIGSEGRGVRDTLRAEAAGIRIPTTGVESLNAAMAAGILLYEARRQRQLDR
jgi:RNA methyltransferase, TrmH family